MEARIDVGKTKDPERSEARKNRSRQKEYSACDGHDFPLDMRYLAKEIVATNDIKAREIATSI